MLHQFLIAERAGILALCLQKSLLVAEQKDSSVEMDEGNPLFYDELIEVLRIDEVGNEDVSIEQSLNIHHNSAVKRGKESLRLGYTVSQVVQGYGALCQAITEFVGENGGRLVSAREFTG